MCATPAPLQGGLDKLSLLRNYHMTAYARKIMASSQLTCVSLAELSSRPSYVPESDEPDDMFWVLNMGAPFKYVIPSFDVLAVELRQMRVGGDRNGVGQVYDVFIRGNDVSLTSKNYPALMLVKDYINIEVRTYSDGHYSCTCVLSIDPGHRLKNLSSQSTLVD